MEVLCKDDNDADLTINIVIEPVKMRFHDPIMCNKFVCIYIYMLCVCICNVCNVCKYVLYCIVLYCVVLYCNVM